MKRIRIIKDIPGYCSGSKIETDHSIIATPRDTNYIYDISELVDDGYAEYITDEPGEGFTVVHSPRIDYCGRCKKDHSYECPMDTAPQLPSKLKMEDLTDYNTATHRLMHRVNTLIDVVAYLLAKDK